MMMVFQANMAQDQINKCLTRIQRDRMLSVKINFHQPPELTKRTTETMRPNKRCKLSNAAVLLDGFVVQKVSFLVPEDAS